MRFLCALCRSGTARGHATTRRPSTPQHLSLSRSLYFSAFALLISSLGLWYQSELSSSLSFLRRHPTAAVAMAGFSLVSAVQQQFVMLTVKHYGPGADAGPQPFFSKPLPCADAVGRQLTRV